MLRFAKEVLKPVVGWGFDIFIEETPRYRRCYRDPVKLDRRIKEIARRLIPSTEVYIFGSVSPGQVYGWERYRCDVLIATPNSCSREVLDRLRAEIARWRLMHL